MKICLAQSKPTGGDIAANIKSHLKFIDLAIANGADTIIFPELSITGYEPGLVNDLATHPNDPRFDVFQKISNENKIHICAGMPLKTPNGIQIGLIIFSPGKSVQSYTKQYLHDDELPFFIPGQKQELSFEQENKLSLSICYELSIPTHSQQAFMNGAEIYLSSVAKTASGLETGNETLSKIARDYHMTVLMVNAVGPSDNFVSAGSSAAWNKKGEMIGQLDPVNEGILVVDTAREQLVELIAGATAN